MSRGYFAWGVIVWGICPGVYVWGIFVWGVFVLEPSEREREWQYMLGIVSTLRRLMIVPTPS